MTPTTLRRALSKGSISLRLYPHVGLSAPEMVRELRHQAVLATEAGFDGVMTSEHHGGFAGYMPNPLQAAGWLLEAMPTGGRHLCPCSSRCARLPWSPRRWRGWRHAPRTR